MKVRDLYLVGKGLVINKRNIVRLWKDVIIGNIPLCDKHPLLFEICVDETTLLINIFP